jgi:hypothetical protein
MKRTATGESWGIGVVLLFPVVSDAHRIMKCIKEKL